MDLDAILKKTKEKSDRIKRNREPVYIAKTERPYENSDSQRKSNNKVTTINSKTNNNLITKCEQDSKSNGKEMEKWQQSNNKVVPELITQVTTNLQQSDNKLTTNRSFSALVGLQRSIILLIYLECKKSRSKITEPLTLEYIEGQINADKKTIKTSIYRLEIKGYLLRNEFKNGRGGWTRYELPKEVFHELLQNETNNKLTTNQQQIINKVAPEVITQPTTMLSSSSSNNNNTYKTTTTELPDHWLIIDLSATRSFGFTENHLLQLYRTGNFTPEVIENSIQHFLFDLKYNNKIKEIKTNPLSYFMGILKRVGVYSAPENYESPRDRAMRCYLEKQKIALEKKEAMERECIILEFDKWLETLSEDEKNKIIPDEAKNINLVGPKIAALRTHFEKIIWPIKKNQISGEIN